MDDIYVDLDSKATDEVEGDVGSDVIIVGMERRLNSSLLGLQAHQNILTKIVFWKPVWKLNHEVQDTFNSK